MAPSALRHNIILAVVIAAAAMFLFLWGCPYMAIFGHKRLCIALYVVLMIIYVVGRANPVPRKRPPDDLVSRGG